jgi:uncharacterized protein YegL
MPLLDRHLQEDPLSTSNNRVAWPFYVALDVSKSMQTTPQKASSEKSPQESPWEQMQRALPDLLFELEKSATAADIAHLTIVAFSDDVVTYLPRTRIADGAVGLDSLPKGMQTNYSKLFCWLHSRISADLRELTATYKKVKRPALYMITDGEPVVGSGSQPEAEWLPELTKVHGIRVYRAGTADVATIGLPIAVISLGFGNVSESTLARISQKPGGAFVAEDHDAQPDLLIPALIDAILNSVLSSVEAEEVAFQTPKGMRRID